MVIRTGYRWAAIACLMLVSGCDGCRREVVPDDAAAKAEREKPPLTTAAAKSFPTTRVDAGTRGAIDGAVKPGHWTGASISLRSNRDDRRGNLQTTITAKRMSAEIRPDLQFEDDVNTQSNGRQVYATQFEFQSFPVTRPAVLPKGQMRRLDTRLLVPDLPTGASGQIVLSGAFTEASTTLAVELQPATFVPMPAEAVFFVILTDRPERFARLQVADWTAPLRDETMFTRGRTSENYRIVVPPTDGVLPIAETALDWTSTAVVLWDDLPARSLTPPQRTALADWVRMGGTLIVNGPIAAGALADDELSELLPIVNQGNDELDAESTAGWLKSLAVETDASVPAVSAQLADGTARVTLAGPIKPGAVGLGENDVLAQSRVGHGRVVQSRVDLLSDWLTAWDSYDSFFNGAILARPPRRIIERNETIIRDESDMQTMRQSFVGLTDGLTQGTTDPRVNSGLRLFARDAKLPDLDDPLPNAENLWLDPTIAPHPISGMGGWKDESDVLRAFQRTLASQIGVTIPKLSLIVRALAFYLAILIPINYLVFRLMGRLEWAWLAILPISIVGAVVVARVAQLDVGFVRSRSELAILEMHADYPRGHLTRIVGLYNSLASGYTVQFDSTDAAITLMQTQRDDRNVGVFGPTPVTMSVGVNEGPALDGITVGSNSYAAIHTEQMISVGGSFVLQSELKPVDAPESDSPPTGDERLFNRTTLDVTDAFVVRRDADGQTAVAAIGGLMAGDQAKLSFRDPATITVPAGLPLGTSEFLQRLIRGDGCPPGTMRLIGRVSDPLGGMTISPECSQTRAETIVLVHLKNRPLPPVSIDKNLIGDFRRKAE